MNEDRAREVDQQVERDAPELGLRVAYYLDDENHGDRLDHLSAETGRG